MAYQLANKVCKMDQALLHAFIDLIIALLMIEEIFTLRTLLMH
jgi:hypothetical protein